MKNAKTLKWLLTLACLLAALCAFTLAANAEIIDSGTCGAEIGGKNLTWTLDDAGTLTISGTGEMNNYSPYSAGHSNAPWGKSAAQSIKTVVIQNGVTSIGANAFYNCKSLTDLTISDNVTRIEGNAFYGCTGLTDITIPDSVTFISGAAFYKCTGLTNVTIPDSVTSIVDYTFYGCTGLTNITIPDSVTSIGTYAFCFCSGLSSVTIPDSVTFIGSSAFLQCTRLTSISIPDSVTSIGYDAFSDTAWYKNQPDGLAYAGKVAYKYIGTMPQNTSIILKNGTKGIAGRAFYCCSGLSSVTIPDSVRDIGVEAFYKCTGLTDLIIPDSVMSIWSSAFSGCSCLTSVTIPNSITSIEGRTFEDCRGLISVAIPDNVTSIGYYAFSGCLGLSFVTIPDSVTSIGNSAFSRCVALKSITIPDGVTIIAADTFCDCGLIAVTIPDSVTKIGRAAFNYCEGLKDVYYSGSEEQWDKISIDYVNDPLLSATIHYNSTAGQERKCGDNAFWEFAPDDGVLRISGSGDMWDYSTFCEPWYDLFDEIKSVKIEGVTSIGDSAFAGLLNIAKVELPSSVTSIGANAFRDCGALTAIRLFSDLKTVGDNAFLNCENLEYISYSASVKDWELIEIGNNNQPLKKENVCFEHPAETEQRTKKITYSYDMDKEPAKDKKTSIDVFFNSNWFNTPSTKETYQHELAQFCSQFVTIGYGRTAQVKTALRSFGFEDFFDEKIDINLSTGRDEVNYFIASKTIFVNNQEKTLIFCGFIGSHNLQWNSNFDPYGTERSDTSDPNLFGTSAPGTVHLGFEDAKTFVMNKLDAYITKLGIAPEKTKILVTGHSRGAATANLVAADLIRGALGTGKCKKYCNADDVYAYSFATPNNVKVDKIKDFDYDCFKRIFNIVNPQDFVTYVLPKDWGFSKYGTTYLLPTRNNVDPEKYTEYKNEMLKYFAQVRPGTTFADYDLGEITTYNVIKKFTETIKNLDEFYQKPLLAYSEKTYVVNGGMEGFENKIITKKPFEYFKEVLCPFVNNVGSKVVALGLAVKILNFDMAQDGLYSRLTGYFFANGIEFINPNFNHSHMAETYCSYMMKLPSTVITKETANGSKYYSVHCPVDIEIYDKDTGELVGRTVNNVVDEEVAAGESAVVIQVEGDEKTFMLPGMINYEIKYIGYDKGVMDLTVSTIGNDLTETERINFFSVPLEKGTVYDSLSESDAELTDYALITEDEKKIEPDQILDPQETERITVTSFCKGGAITEPSSQYVVSGDYVTVAPVLAQCEAFGGWYIDGKLVSEDSEYRFRPTQDVTLEGKVTIQHTYETVETAPTCTEDGSIEYTCTVCGEKKTETVPAVGHTVEIDPAVALTCTDDGKTEGSHCAGCGMVLKEQEPVKATGHQWNDGVITKEATSDAEGEKTFTCTVCGATKTEPVPKLIPSEPTTPTDPEKPIDAGNPVDTERKPGDVDGDGKITSGDARLALRASVGLEPDIVPGTNTYLACDVDGDGKVTSADARLILRASVGLEDASKFGKKA